DSPGFELAVGGIAHGSSSRIAIRWAGDQSPIALGDRSNRRLESSRLGRFIRVAHCARRRAVDVEAASPSGEGSPGAAVRSIRGIDRIAASSRLVAVNLMAVQAGFSNHTADVADGFLISR